MAYVVLSLDARRRVSRDPQAVLKIQESIERVIRDSLLLRALKYDH